MMRTAYITGCLLLLVSLVPTAASASINFLPWRAPHEEVNIHLVGSSIPTDVQTGFQAAISLWNSQGCNEGLDDFPELGNFGPSLPVEWNPGKSPAQADGSTVCARLVPSLDGTTSKIELFRLVRLAGGSQDYPCFTNSQIATQTIAHEIGHYFGLNHPGNNSPGDGTCTQNSAGQTFVMSGRNGTPNGALIIWDTDRVVTQDECRAADTKNSTDKEVEAERSGGDPTGTNTEDPPREQSPILFDLDGDGFHLTGRSFPVDFDIDGDGFLERISWTHPSSEDSFLAWDRNGNGVIDNGRELFGNATEQPLHDEPNGFLALAVLDRPAHGGNGDGWITSADAVFEHLLLWDDGNHDGISQDYELQFLERHRIAGIDLAHHAIQRRDRYGNVFRWMGRYNFEDGHWNFAMDVIFVEVGTRSLSVGKR